MMVIKQGWSGRVFEDFEVGDVYRHSLGRTVLATDNIWFTLLTMNTNPIHFAMLKEAYPLLAHFDDFVLSYEVRAAKPEAKIYHDAMARVQCKPEACFFTDDLAVNVTAARELGMDAVQFLSAEQLERELRVRGLC